MGDGMAEGRRCDLRERRAEGTGRVGDMLGTGLLLLGALGAGQVTELVKQRRLLTRDQEDEQAPRRVHRAHEQGAPPPHGRNASRRASFLQHLVLNVALLRRHLGGRLKFWTLSKKAIRQCPSDSRVARIWQSATATGPDRSVTGGFEKDM